MCSEPSKVYLLGTIVTKIIINFVHICHCVDSSTKQVLNVTLQTIYFVILCFSLF